MSLREEADARVRRVRLPPLSVHGSGPDRRDHEKPPTRDEATLSRETESNDFISMLMFEPHYTSRLIEIGENDVASRLVELRTFLGQPSVPAISAV